MTNIVNFPGAQTKKNDDDDVVVLEQFMPGRIELTMSLRTRLDVIGKLTLEAWLKEREIVALEIHELVHVARELLHLVHFQFNVLSSISVQQSKKDKTDLSLSMYGAELDRFKEAETNGKPLRMNFQIQVSQFTMEEELPQVSLVDRNKLVVDVDKTSSITVNHLYRIMANMETIALTSGGTTYLSADGKYVAMFRHSHRHVFVMGLAPEIPITLDPNCDFPVNPE